MKVRNGAAAAHATGGRVAPRAGGHPAATSGRGGRPPVGRLVVPAVLATSSVFHYLGPACAALLFTRVDPLGVAWLRIASAAALLAAWRRPWRRVQAWGRAELRLLAALGAVLAAMNTVFYLAIARLPLSTVGAVEFLGVVALAAAGVRGRRNALALCLAVAGVAVLADVRLAGSPLGFAFAFANCALFVLYVVLGHRVSRIRTGTPTDRVDLLAAAMLVAAAVATPAGLPAAAPALARPPLLAAGVAVGVCSSVVPYLADQVAMARLRRATFALLLSVLPASAAVMGLIVLGQRPTGADVVGVALVVAAVAVHRQGDPAGTAGHGRSPHDNPMPHQRRPTHDDPMPNHRRASREDPPPHHPTLTTPHQRRAPHDDPMPHHPGPNAPTAMGRRATPADPRPPSRPGGGPCGTPDSARRG